METIEGDHPAYIDPHEFDLLLSARADRDLAPGKHKTGGRPNKNHLLAKMATCVRCGEPMRAITSSYRREDGKRRRKYRCANVADQTGLCDAPSIDADLIEGSVVDNLRGLIVNLEEWMRQSPHAGGMIGTQSSQPGA